MLNKTHMSRKANDAIWKAQKLMSITTNSAVRGRLGIKCIYKDLINLMVLGIRTKLYIKCYSVEGRHYNKAPDLR